MAVVPNVWIFLPIAALAGLSWTVSRMTKSETEVIHRALEMHAGSETPVVRHYLRANRRSTPLGFGQFRKRIEDWFSNADVSNSREQKKPGWSRSLPASIGRRDKLQRSEVWIHQTIDILIYRINDDFREFSIANLLPGLYEANWEKVWPRSAKRSPPLHVWYMSRIDRGNGG